MAKQNHSLHKKNTTTKATTYIVLIIGAIISLIPFVWMISTSFKSLGEALGSSFFPSELHFENYVEAWKRARFSEYFINSIVIAAITLVRAGHFQYFCCVCLCADQISWEGFHFWGFAQHNDDPGNGEYHPQFFDRHLAGANWAAQMDQ